MTKIKPHSSLRSFELLTAIILCAGGCGGGSISTPTLSLSDRDAVAAILPKGVTLESPIVPNKLYGESSKTVEDALISLQAVVKNGLLQGGVMKQEIRFDTGSGSEGTKKTPKKPAGPVIVIQLAH